MRNLIHVVRSMLDSGATTDEIVKTLKEMGVSEEDARKLIILANREILLTLRNELKDIVRSVLEEEREDILSDLKEEITSFTDTRLKMINRNLFKLTREEMNKYISELSRVEEKVELLEKKVLQLEEKGGSSIIRARNIKKKGIIPVILGILAILVSYFVEIDPLINIAILVVGLIFIIGGFLLG